jgi:hypothetical protein
VSRISPFSDFDARRYLSASLLVTACFSVIVKGTLVAPPRTRLTRRDRRYTFDDILT